jgi:hypothetical protein
MEASGRCGSLSPPGPVSMARVKNVACFTCTDGPLTINSARPAGGMRISLLVTSLPLLVPSCEPVGTPSSATI